MGQAINSQVIKESLRERGWTQARLAEEVGVTSQAVTHWLRGENFPRPAVILKLVAVLGLRYEKLVVDEEEIEPVIAFRRKGGAKTVEAHIRKAVGIGRLLRPLVPYLKAVPELRTQIASPSTDPVKVQAYATEARKRLGVGQQKPLRYEDLIKEFERSGTILVPVLWGEKKRHENALHIGLPKENVTFVFLNLDTRIEDFGFWMAHELAHIYTPQWAGTDQGEDFADAFAGALLFPRACAETVYAETMQAHDRGKLRVLQSHAKQHDISPYTVFKQVQIYAELEKQSGIPIKEKDIHALRNRDSGELVSRLLFGSGTPGPEEYVKLCEDVFRSDFFKGLKRMIQEHGTGYAYTQQVIDSSVHDARALHEGLIANAGFA